MRQAVWSQVFSVTILNVVLEVGAGWKTEEVEGVPPG